MCPTELSYGQMPIKPLLYRTENIHCFPEVLDNIPSCDYVILHGARMLTIFMFSGWVHLTFKRVWPTLSNESRSFLSLCFLTSRLIASRYCVHKASVSKGWEYIVCSFFVSNWFEIDQIHAFHRGPPCLPVYIIFSRIFLKHFCWEFIDLNYSTIQ